MRIITEIELTEFLGKETYTNREEKLVAICFIFDNTAYEVIMEKLKVGIEDIVYSRYFWFQQFKKVFIEQHAWTVDFEQQEYQLLEHIDHYGCVNFGIIEKIENGAVNENDVFETEA